MIGMFSFSVDFQRDIWRNDSFEILYEEEFIKYDKSNKNLENRYGRTNTSLYLP